MSRSLGRLCNNQYQDGQRASQSPGVAMHIRVFWVATEGRKTPPYGTRFPTEFVGVNGLMPLRQNPS